MSFVVQDWEPVVFTRKKETTPKVAVVVGTKKVEKNLESFEHKKIPKSIAEAIQRARLELKLTQAQLAKKINEHPSVVNDIEACRGVYNPVHINKTLKALGLSLKQCTDQTRAA